MSETENKAPRPYGRIKLPAIGDELYEQYPAMSAQTHADLIKDYARNAVRAALVSDPAVNAGASVTKDLLEACKAVMKADYDLHMGRGHDIFLLAKVAKAIARAEAVTSPSPRAVLK